MRSTRPFIAAFLVALSTCFILNHETHHSPLSALAQTRSSSGPSSDSIWSARDPQLSTFTPENAPLTWYDSVAIADAENFAIAGSGRTIKILSLRTGALIRTLSGHSGIVNSIAVSPDGQTLASGSTDKTIKLWNWRTGAPIRTLEGHQESVNAVAFSPDGQTLASGSVDKTIKLWNWRTGALVYTLGNPFTGHTETVNSVAFSPDGKTLASGSTDKTIKLWNVTNGFAFLFPATLSGHEERVSAVAFSPDGQTLASGSADTTIKLWDWQKKSLIRTLNGHEAGVNALGFSPDGQTLASGSGALFFLALRASDNTVKLWNWRTGSLIRTLTGYGNSIKSIAFSADGQTLVSAGLESAVRVWRSPSSSLTVNPLASDFNYDRMLDAIIGETTRDATNHILASGNFDRGITLLRQGQYQQALDALNQAAQFLPDDPYVWYNRGVALGRLRRYRDAIGSFDKAIELKQGNYPEAQAARNAAQACLNQGGC